MRALLVVFEWSRTGGLEGVTVEIAQALLDLGIHLDVWSIRDTETKVIDGIPSVGLAPRPRGFQSINARWFWKIRLSNSLVNICRSYDLLIVGHAHILPTLHRILKLENRPEIWTWTYGREVWGNPGREVAPYLDKVDRVVTISEFTRREISKYAPSAKTHVIPCALDVNRFVPAKDSSLINRNQVLCVGRLDKSAKYKGIDTLIRLLPSIEKTCGKALELSIVGSGNDLNRLQEIADGLRLKGRVNFRGRLSFGELIEAYQTGAVFAMPSWVKEMADGSWTGEGFGRVYVEAQACGRPVVVSCHGGAPETLQPNITGFLVDPTDTEEIVQVIARLLLDDVLADEMGKAGRRWVEQNFNFDLFRERIRVLLQ